MSNFCNFLSPKNINIGLLLQKNWMQLFLYTTNAYKLLMKSTPGVNFINILRSLFCRNPFVKKSQCGTVIRKNLCNLLSYEKRSRKMWVKLTPVLHHFQKGSLYSIFHLFCRVGNDQNSSRVATHLDTFYNYTFWLYIPIF